MRPHRRSLHRYNVTPHSIVRSLRASGGKRTRHRKELRARDDDRRREGAHGGGPGCGHAPPRRPPRGGGGPGSPWHTTPRRALSVCRDDSEGLPKSLVRWAEGFGTVRRCAGVEGTSSSSYGTGIAPHLRTAAIPLTEIERPKRRHHLHRNSNKSDSQDAESAARAGERPERGQACPRARRTAAWR